MDGYTVRDLLHRLAGKADVLIESFRPGEADGLGMGYTDMHGRFHRLVYASISAHGQTGPRRDRPGHEALVAARMGLQHEQKGQRPGPHFGAYPMISYGTGLLTVIGVCSALHARETTGKGQHVDLAMEAGVLVMSSMFWQWVENKPPERARGVQGDRRFLNGMFECSDGKRLGMHTGAPGAFGRALKAWGLEDRISPSPYPQEMGLPLPPEEGEIIRTEVPEIFKSRPRDEWIRRLQEADVAVMPVDPPGVILSDPQVQHNGAVRIADDPELGRPSRSSCCGSPSRGLGCCPSCAA